MNPLDPVSIGVGFDTARYGHHVSFLRPDRQPAANPFTFAESSAGYAQLRQALEKIQNKYKCVQFQIRIDAAGQYAANLEAFLRALPWEKTISVGQPKQNRDYCRVHFPKRKADAVEAEACARFAIGEHPAPTPETTPAFAQLRELAGALESQVKQTTRLVNQLHNRLARVFPELALEVPVLSATWVLQLLAKYPTPAKIAAAHRSSLVKIPHLSEDKAEKIQTSARTSVASLQGLAAERLIEQTVRAVQQSQAATQQWKQGLEEAYDALPTGAHRQIETIPGIGRQTAAVLVAKMISIDRFATPGAVVSYFGAFPEENSSGVDKFGRPHPVGTSHMSAKGSDLVRRCLWNAAMSATIHNPVIRSMYARQRAQGKRGDVALGHAMRKLLHLVFAVWKTDRPFTAPEVKTDDESVPHPSETTDQPTPPPETKANDESIARPSESAEGRKGQGPERSAVTPAPSKIPPAPAASNTSASCGLPTAGGRIDFASLRRQITMEQVLRELCWWDCLKGHGPQLRGPCPLHESSNPQGRCFSVHTGKNIFRCFDSSCGAKGNVLDFWAQHRSLPLPQAALELAERFGVACE